MRVKHKEWGYTDRDVLVSRYWRITQGGWYRGSVYAAFAPEYKISIPGLFIWLWNRRKGEIENEQHLQRRNHGSRERSRY